MSGFDGDEKTTVTALYFVILTNLRIAQHPEYEVAKTGSLDFGFSRSSLNTGSGCQHFNS